MKGSRGPRPAIWLAVLAFAGLVAGHWFSYLIVAPSAHARQELLEATGHGSHDLLVTLGLAAGVAALIAMVASHLRNREASRSTRPVRSALWLWLIQTVGFVALEASERVHGLHELSTLIHEPAFLVGLLAQAVVALVAAFVIWALRATVDAILRLLCLPSSREEPLPAPLRVRAYIRSSVARAAWNLRGPPVAARNQG